MASTAQKIGLVDLFWRMAVPPSPLRFRGALPLGRPLRVLHPQGVEDRRPVSGALFLCGAALGDGRGLQAAYAAGFHTAKGTTIQFGICKAHPVHDAVQSGTVFQTCADKSPLELGAVVKMSMRHRAVADDQPRQITGVKFTAIQTGIFKLCTHHPAGGKGAAIKDTIYAVGVVRQAVDGHMVKVGITEEVSNYRSKQPTGHWSNDSICFCS